jgi:hypothetical protein
MNMKAVPTLHEPGAARRRSMFAAVVAACLIAGATAGPAGAVNAFTLDHAPDGGAGVAVDSAGAGYFAWEHKASPANDVTEFCKVARGATCTNPVVLPTPPLNGAPYNSIDVSAAFPVLGPGATVYVVGPRYVAQVVPSGGFQGSNPTDVLAAGGGFDISSINPGVNFTSTPTPTTGADLTPPGGLTNITDSSLGLAAGNPVEAYSRLDTNPDSIEFRGYSGTGDVNDAANWSAPAHVTDGELPRLAGGAIGALFRQVNVRRYTPGAGFGRPVTLQSDTPTDNIGSMFQTPTSGQLLVAWQGTDQPNGGIGIRLYRSIDGGASFSAVGAVAQGTPNWAADALRMAAAADGKGFLTFVEGGGGQSLLQVADLNPIDPLTVAGHRVAGSTITTQVTLGSSGTMAVAGTVKNLTALASVARKITCRKVAHKCMSSAFGARTLRISKAGRYTIRLAANRAATRALSRGRTLRVSETLSFRPTGAHKTTVKTFTATVRGIKVPRRH